MDCQRAIGAINISIARINANDIGSSSGMPTYDVGVEIDATAGASFISQNRIRGFRVHGIFVRNWGNQFTVAINELVSTGTTSTTTGIQMSSSLNLGYAIIDDNTVHEIPRNIVALNIVTNSMNHTVISNNTVPAIQGMSGFSTGGIFVRNCSDAEIVDNTLIGHCVGGGCLIRGIHVEHSERVLSEENTLTNCDAGFVFHGDCTLNNVRCNTISNCEYGVGMHALSFFGPVHGPGAIGSGATTPSGNCFFPETTANRTYALDGTFASLFFWYFDNTDLCKEMESVPTTDFNGFQFGSSALLPFSSSSSTDGCAMLSMEALKSESELRELGQTLLDKFHHEIDNSNYCSDFDAKYAIYKFFRTHFSTSLPSSIEHLETSDYDEVYEIESKIAEGDLTTARTLCGSLLLECSQAVNYRDITEIALNGQLRPYNAEDYRLTGSKYTPGELVILNSMANQDIAANGKAVIAAQTMLGIFNLVDFNPTPSSPRFEKLEIKSPLVYPNPSREMLYFITDSFNNAASIQVYDLDQKLRIENMVEGQEFVEVDVSRLNPGIYLIKVADSNGEVLSELFVKQ